MKHHYPSALPTNSNSPTAAEPANDEFNNYPPAVARVNRAKVRLSALAAEERRTLLDAARIEQHFEPESFKTRVLLFIEIMIVALAVFLICRRLFAAAPLEPFDLFSLLMDIGIAGFLFKRLDGLRKHLANQKRLALIRSQMETAETVIDGVTETVARDHGNGQEKSAR